MKKIAIVTIAGLAFLVAPQLAVAQQQQAAKAAKPECFCTDTYGKRRELGDIICLTVGGRSYEAKCIMVLNNPFWRDQERGCLSSSLPGNMNLRKNEVAALYQ